MLKITEIGRTECEITLKLEGRIAECWLEEISKVCEPALSAGCRIVFDMSDVRFVERRAVLFLCELQQRRVTLTNCSPFLSEQLKKGDFYANNAAGN